LWPGTGSTNREPAQFARAEGSSSITGFQAPTRASNAATTFRETPFVWSCWRQPRRCYRPEERGQEAGAHHKRSPHALIQLAGKVINRARAQRAMLGTLSECRVEEFIRLGQLTVSHMSRATKGWTARCCESVTRRTHAIGGFATHSSARARTLAKAF